MGTSWLHGACEANPLALVISKLQLSLYQSVRSKFWIVQTQSGEWCTLSYEWPPNSNNCGHWDWRGICDFIGRDEGNRRWTPCRIPGIYISVEEMARFEETNSSYHCRFLRCKKSTNFDYSYQCPKHRRWVVLINQEANIYKGPTQCTAQGAPAI